jgi:hypothetical protein
MVTFESLVTTGFFLVGSPESVQRNALLWRTVMGAMKRVRRLLSHARAQSILASDAASPLQEICLSELNQPIQSGQLTVTNRSALNHAVVGKFIQEHPNLPGFAPFVASTPTGSDVVPTPDGNNCNGG